MIKVVDGKVARGSASTTVLPSSSGSDSSPNSRGDPTTRWSSYETPFSLWTLIRGETGLSEVRFLGRASAARSRDGVGNTNGVARAAVPRTLASWRRRSRARLVSRPRVCRSRPTGMP